MIRLITRGCALGLMVCAAASPAFAQVAGRAQASADVRPGLSTASDFQGVIQDDKGQPLAGAVVSALGVVTVFEITDANGRFVFRNLERGPYLLRVHLQGYTPARPRVVEVTSSQRSAFVVSLTRSPQSAEPPAVLAAGVGGGTAAATQPEERAHDHDERAWRLRHAKRSVLRDGGEAVEGIDGEPDDGSWERVERAVGTPGRVASTLFSDVTGQINLLTTTTFNSPQELFVLDAAMPQAVAYMSLVVPGRGGEWLMRGTITRGDLSSWILSGAYRRDEQADHSYEAAFSYGTQRYLGTGTDALLTISDTNRNVGTMYAYDNWTLVPRIRVGYGAQYSRYDYLEDPGLLSPRASVTIQPSAHDPLKVRALVSRRETAPGAIEFMPTATGPWLPPERTFAQVSGAAFQPERLDHVELAAEREWAGAIVVGVRAFRQSVDDQMVTIFGLGLAGSPTGIGHYFVGSAGDFTARGWSVSVSRAVASGVRASVDYTQSTADWYGGSPDAETLAILAPQVLRASERVHDVTATLDSVVTASATRVCVIYKMNSAFSNPRDNFSGSLTSARFNVQVNQALPFLNFASANWEMLAAISNLFTGDAVNGSVYDEALVVQPPKRILGGVTVRF